MGTSALSVFLYISEAGVTVAQGQCGHSHIEKSVVQSPAKNQAQDTGPFVVYERVFPLQCFTK